MNEGLGELKCRRHFFSGKYFYIYDTKTLNYDIVDIGKSTSEGEVWEDKQ